MFRYWNVSRTQHYTDIIGRERLKWVLVGITGDILHGNKFPVLLSPNVTRDCWSEVELHVDEARSQKEECPPSRARAAESG